MLRVYLSDRVARLNGETVRLLLLDDLPGFKVRGEKGEGRSDGERAYA